MSRNNPLRGLPPLPNLPRIETVMVPPGTPITQAPEPILVTVTVGFSDGHEETCSATAWAWTTDAVFVLVQARDGQYITWVPAAQVRRRSGFAGPRADQ